MGTRKHISVNLRDLQRVMNKEEDELPNTKTETKSKFGATKNFEYKLSNNRWENEDYDDDFDLPAEKLVEPDFSTLRDPEPKPVVERKQPAVKVDDSSLDDNWRSQDFGTNDDTSDAWRTVKPKEDQKNHSSNFRNSFPPSKNKDQELTREAKNEEPKKLYVPRFKRESVEKPENDRFSCLEDPRDDNSPIRANSLKDSGPFSRNENDRKEDRPRDDWGFIEKNEERPRNDRFREDRYKEDDKSKKSVFSTEVRSSLIDEKKTKEALKKGLFVPSYRRNLKKEETVEDIFIKAAGLTESNKQTKTEKVKEAEKPKGDKLNLAEFDQELKSKKEVGEADKPKKEAKKNEVINHNNLFKCSTETVSLVEEYVLSQLTAPDDDSHNTRSGFPEFDEEGSIVPAIVTCVIVLKSCERCTTLQEVHAMFKNVQKWLLHTTQNHDTRVLLTELAKSTHHWGYPSLSTSVYLIEALFDSLYTLGVVNKSVFLQWFERDVDEIPDRVTLLIQLMDWKKWLSGENLEELVEESESESEEDDSDIEANVPKPIRLTKGVKFNKKYSEMKLSNKLRSGEGKLTADMSYLEQTSQLKQNLRNKAVPDLTTKSNSDVGVSDLQVGGDYGGVSHGLMTIFGNAALGALGGVAGGLGGMGAPLQAYGMPTPGVMGPNMMGPSMMPHPGMGARMMPPPRGYMAQPPRRM